MSNSPEWLLSSCINSERPLLCLAASLQSDSFYQHYYAHGNVLDTSSTLSELYAKSPLLFWTVILISSRTHTQYSTFFAELKKPYEQLLAPHLIKGIHSLYDIHAILILITWPIPVRSQPDDPTWNYCGLVTNAARLIGLHQPGREKEYGFPKVTPQEVYFRSMAWLYIFNRSITYVF